MKLKYDEEKKAIVVRFKEEPIAYRERLLKFMKPAFIYYSEKGEIVEIRVSDVAPKGVAKIRTLEKASGGMFTGCTEIGETNEVEIPEIKQRRYAFTFGKENDIKECVDSYDNLWDHASVDDVFYRTGSLMVQRMDGKEMSKDKIKEWRRGFLEDMEHDLIGCMYKNKKLYFWLKEGDYLPHSMCDFIKEEFEYDMSCEMKLREGRACVFIWHNGYDYDMLSGMGLGSDLVDENVLLIVIDCYDIEIGEDVIITREELVDICKNIWISDYKGPKVILLWFADLSEDAIEYARSQNIKIVNSDDLSDKILIERNMRKGELFDEDPEMIDISGIFGDE